MNFTFKKCSICGSSIFSGRKVGESEIEQTERLARFESDHDYRGSGGCFRRFLDLEYHMDAHRTDGNNLRFTATRLERRFIKDGESVLVGIERFIHGNEHKS